MSFMMYRHAVVSDVSCVHLLMYATFQEITNSTTENLVLLRFSDKIHFLILGRKNNFKVVYFYKYYYGVSKNVN